MSEKEKKIEEYKCTPRSHPKKLSECGSKWMIKTKYYVDKDGVEQSEPGEKIDFDAYIQASKASCDISQIIARYNAGDETVLNVNPNGLTGDLSIIPQNINDVTRITQMSDVARANYDKLPDEIKALYGSPAEFFNAVLNNKAEEILKSYLSKKTEEPITPKESEETK